MMRLTEFSILDLHFNNVVMETAVRKTNARISRKRTQRIVEGFLIPKMGDVNAAFVLYKIPII